MYIKYITSNFLSLFCASSFISPFTPAHYVSVGYWQGLAEVEGVERHTPSFPLRSSLLGNQASFVGNSGTFGSLSVNFCCHTLLPKGLSTRS